MEWLGRSETGFLALHKRYCQRNFCGDESIGNVAITNLVKCSGVPEDSSKFRYKDTTLPCVAENCICKLGVIGHEISIIQPTHIIFYTHTRYDDYIKGNAEKNIKSMFERLHIIVDDKKKIGSRNMPWLEAEGNVGDLKLQILRIGHPQGKKKADFVGAVCDWIRRTPENNL